MPRLPPPSGNARRGAAASEFALVLPFLALLLLLAVDFTRIFYYSLTLADCARKGALYAADPVRMSESPYQSTQDAALADVSTWSPPPQVYSWYGADSNGAFAEVTVSYTFSTIVSYPGVPSPVSLSRTVRMGVMPTTPN
jgi:Flp pilus assembly protein TadG